jgi:hypothetical protein
MAPPFMVDDELAADCFDRWIPPQHGPARLRMAAAIPIDRAIATKAAHVRKLAAPRVLWESSMLTDVERNWLILARPRAPRLTGNAPAWLTTPPPWRADID